MQEISLLTQKKREENLHNPRKYVPLHSQNKSAGCSSARLEYASGGRVVAGSNPVTPTGDYQGVKSMT